MGEDWFLRRLAAVEQAAEGARAALAAAHQVLEPARSDRLAGRPLTTITQELVARGLAPRRAAAEAWRAYERAVAEFRAAVIYALVEEEGLTFTQLSKTADISRQAVARLYQAGERQRQGPD